MGHIGLDGKGQPVFNFGKYKGQLVANVFNREPSYYDWMMKADFPLSTKQCITEIHEGMKAQKILDLQAHFGH